MLPLLETRTETLPTDTGSPIVRVVFGGAGGAFSAGHHHGHQMNQVLQEAMERHSPCGVVIDVQDLIYPGGDWIAWGAIQTRAKGCPTCLVAAEPSMESIRMLWDPCRLGTIIPLFTTLEQARLYLLSPEAQQQRRLTHRSHTNRSAYLKVVRGHTAETTFKLVEERTIIGRHPTCHIVLENIATARRHAVISSIDGAYFLEDQRSAGGTIRNGVRITGPTELKDGDLIQLGGCELSFHIKEK